MNYIERAGGQIAEESYQEHNPPEEFVIALAGNPNTGKSTVFNSLTGLKQHTGNWPGKTVTNAQGKYSYRNHSFLLVDLPGTYSLFANSVDEEVARDFLCSGKPVVTVVVADATCLERNLNLALQVMEITDNVVLCVNLLDEARRKQIKVDLPALSECLGVPVVGTSARDGVGLEALKDVIYRAAVGAIKPQPLRVRYAPEIESSLDLLTPAIQDLVNQNVNPRWAALRLLDANRGIAGLSLRYPFLRFDADQDILNVVALADRLWPQTFATLDGLRDHIVTCIVNNAEDIARRVLTCARQNYNAADRQIDSILTSRVWGIPVMLLLLGLVFWITIKGANYPSQVLAAGLFGVEDKLTEAVMSAGWPDWLHGLLILGMYRTLAWVISVMLPPMAIFFPLFTLLEDLGYLPRIAFNLDNFFKKACTHGKQALTMCMGFGCNAAGVTSCRIIDSPRERLIAIVTNNFVPCNGRIPTLIALATIFIASGLGGTGRSLRQFPHRATQHGGSMASRYHNPVHALCCNLQVLLT